MFLLECLPRNYLGEDFSNFDDRIFIDGWMFFFLGGKKYIGDGDSIAGGFQIPSRNPEHQI